MLPDRVSNPGPLIYESGALQIALRGPAFFSWTLKNISSSVLKLPQICYHTNSMYWDR